MAKSKKRIKTSALTVEIFTKALSGFKNEITADLRGEMQKELTPVKSDLAKLREDVGEIKIKKLNKEEFEYILNRELNKAASVVLDTLKDHETRITKLETVISK